MIYFFLIMESSWWYSNKSNLIGIIRFQVLEVIVLSYSIFKFKGIY